MGGSMYNTKRQLLLLLSFSAFLQLAAPGQAQESTETPTETPTNTSTLTPVPTRTPSLSPTPTHTPTVTYTSTPTPTRTATPTDACGNGIVDEYEECDDANFHVGDGCSPGCRIEPCWSCIGEPSVCQAAETVVRTLEDAGDVGSHTSLAIGADGLPLITHWDETNKDLRILHCEDPGCETATARVFDDDNRILPYSSVVIDTDGLPLVAYPDQIANLFSVSSGIRIARCNDAACTAADPPVRRGVGTYIRSLKLALGGDGLPILAYKISQTLGGSSETIRAIHCATSTCSSIRPAWTIAQATSDLGDNRYLSSTLDTALATDGKFLTVFGREHNFFLQPFIEETGLARAVCDASDCTTGSLRFVDTATQFSQAQSIAIGADGFAWMARKTGDGGIRVAKCTDAACDNAVVSTVNNSGAVGTFLDTAMAPDGHAVLVYRNAVDKDLHLSRCNDLACTSVSTQIVDDTGDVGTYPSLAFDSSGAAVITYHDVANKDLKIAFVCAYTSGCGNGTLEPGETCDDGNSLDGDACPANCLLPTATFTPTASDTPTPTNTPSTTPSLTPTETPTSTDTPTATPSYTPTGTGTQTPTALPSSTATPSSTASETPTASPTSTFTPTVTATPTAARPCALQPRSDCTAANRSALDFSARNRIALRWKWDANTAAPLLPESAPGEDWVACLYDYRGDQPALDAEIVVSSAHTCGAQSCWSSRTGITRYNYRTSSDRLFLTLRQTRSDRRSIRMLASGDLLARLPHPPTEGMFSQESRLSIQLVDNSAGDRSTGRCWEAVFPSPARNNSDHRFTDRIR